MSRPNAKYEVGQLVDVRSPWCSHDALTVCRVEWRDRLFGIHRETQSFVIADNTYVYYLDLNPHLYSLEKHVFPHNPPAKEGFQEIMQELTPKVTEPLEPA